MKVMQRELTTADSFGVVSLSISAGPEFSARRKRFRPTIPFGPDNSDE